MREDLSHRHRAAAGRASRPECLLLLAVICLCGGSSLFLPGASQGGQGGKTEAPARPREIIELFNGRDLAGLAHWLEDTKERDPRGVFSVQDGMIRISGEGNGYLATHESYRDYHLVVEYRWGKRTDGGKFVRNSGILLHANGPDGGAGGTWMSAIECQLAQGCVGDLIAIRGKDDARGRQSPCGSPATSSRSRQAAALEAGRRKPGLHQRPALVVAARPGFPGTARHARQERRREPPRRVDPGRVPVRRRPDHDPGQRRDGQRVSRRLPAGRQDPAPV